MNTENKETHKRTGYIYPVLSEKDEFVPKTHIGMYSIFRNPKNKNVYMSEAHCQKIRLDTFNSILNLFRKYGSPDFADLFNYNINTFTEIGLNHFARHPKIAPVAQVIECFTYSPNRNSVRRVSFGISKKVLAYYFETRCVPVIYRNKEKTRDFVLYGAEELKLGSDTSVKVDRTALYRRFVDWCTLQGIDQQEGLLMAFELLLNAYPLTDLLPTSEYDLLTEFDKPLFAKRKGVRKGTTTKNVEISNNICALAEDIIARYNRDVDNLTKKIDFDTYINNAIYMLNNNIDLKYQDPELYQEKLETERMIKYTKEQLKKGENKNA